MELTEIGDLSIDESVDRLRINAIEAHQRSIGRGDALVVILERTIKQVERTHRRVLAMSGILFLTGIGVLVGGVAGVLAGRNSSLSATLGALGGLSALAAVFWTAPLDRIAASVTDLVKLEAAFLGYIRVIGEIDSFFQMQYLDILRNPNGAHATLGQTIQNTTTQMCTMMKTTIELIDERVALPSNSVSAIRNELQALTKRVDAIA